MPLLIWLVLALAGTSGLLWQQHTSRQQVAQRFDLRVSLISDFVASYTADLIDRERTQARASLTAGTVQAADFARAVAGFGYPAAVLLDDRGRVIQAVPYDPALIGQDLTGRYAHLATAVRQGRPAVSAVVASAARGLPVVAFAVPFATPSGRRVFSGAVDIRRSSLSAYLSTALTFAGVRIQLVDGAGNLVAANTPLSGVPALTARDLPLAAALGQAPRGRYRAGDSWWRYTSTPIRGTPWRLSATVRQDVLFSSLSGSETAGQAALAGGAVVGLLVVAAAGRARRSRRELQLSEHRFRQVFDGSRIGMTLTDITGRFLRVNPAACQLFGRAETDLVGTAFSDLTHPDDGHVSAQLCRECVAGRIDGFDVDKRYLHSDGRTVDASVTAALLRDGDGRPRYFATQIIDMTERRALERARRAGEAELTRRAEQLQLANAHLADVMAMLSHDVRQPLSTIVGLGDLLLEEWPALSDRARCGEVARMAAAGRRAGDLVTDILTLAQLDAGALHARPALIDVSHAVRDAVANYHSSDATPVAVVAPDQTSALADPAHLHLILGNLLTNATKYGRPPIVVTVTNRRDQVTIDVTDHGEGVPEAFVPHLFERFTRAETGVATTAPGTGLGLYLVHQLATAGGLGIAYRAAEPAGASFTITVPCPAPTVAHVERLRPGPARNQARARESGPGADADRA